MNADMVQGYLDGGNPDNPEPSANRSRSYRHGFQSGRDDLAGKCSASFDERRRMAAEADALDSIDGTFESGETISGALMAAERPSEVVKVPKVAAVPQ